MQSAYCFVYSFKSYCSLQLQHFSGFFFQVLYATFHMVEKYYFVNKDSDDSYLELWVASIYC